MADPIVGAAAASGFAQAQNVATQFAAKGASMNAPLSALFDAVGGVQAQAARVAAMGFVLESLVNYGRFNGPWTDRTGNLRRSYTWEIGKNSKKETVGIFANVASYAVFVEFMPNRWVLSGAVKALQPVIKDMLGIHLSPGKIIKPKTYNMI